MKERVQKLRMEGTVRKMEGKVRKMERKVRKMDTGMVQPTKEVDFSFFKSSSK